MLSPFELPAECGTVRVVRQEFFASSSEAIDDEPINQDDRKAIDANAAIEWKVRILLGYVILFMHKEVIMKAIIGWNEHKMSGANLNAQFDYAEPWKEIWSK